MQFAQKQVAQGVRRWTLRVHLWCGVTISLWAIVIGLSGSVLVFKDEIEGLLHPQLFLIAEQERQTAELPASLSDIAHRVQQQHPEHQLGGFLGLDHTDRSAWMWIYQLDANGELTQRGNVHFNQFTGEILGTVVRYQGFPGWFEKLHFFLLMGRPGLAVNGVMGLTLLLMCATGVVLWWPGRGGFRSGLVVQWRARWRRLNFDIHRVGGFLTAGLLAVMATTGAYFGLHSSALTLIKSAGGMGDLAQVSFLEPPKVTVHSAEAELVSRAQLPLDAVYRFAREEAPQECRLATLALPRKPGAVIVADCISPGNPPFAAMRRMFFHPQSGQLLSNLHSTSQPWGIRLSMAMAPIHFGQWGGTASKIMWSILGLVPGMLAVSGLLMWWNRVLSRNFGRAGSFAAALGFSDKAEKVAARASRFGG